MTKKRLGKGLEALIPNMPQEEKNSKESVVEIAVEKIRANPYQPRTVFEKEKMEELTRSVGEHGIVQPIIVNKERGGYQLVAGERRLRAAKLAGLETIPAIVRQLTKRSLLELALIENLQRQDLNPLEEAGAFKRLMEEFGMTQDGLAKRLGRSRPAIANTIRLLSLSDRVKEFLAAGKITPGQARPLLLIKDPQAQWEAAQKIIQKGLSARAAEKIAKTYGRKGEKHAGKSGKREKNIEEPDLFSEAVRQRLEGVYGTRVKILWKGHRGTIALDFYSEDDLARLTDMLLER